MRIVNLPQDIFSDKKDIGESIIIHDYQAHVGSMKGKSILHKNAISLVISGEKTMLFADKTVNIKNDEFHILTAGNCLTSVSLSTKDVFRSVLVFFDNKVLADFHVKYCARIETLKAQQKMDKEPYLSFKKDAFVLNFIDSLLVLLQGNAAISEDMKLLKFEELMLHLLEKYPERILSFEKAGDKDFDDMAIRKAVETNVTNNISIEELAFLCNISASTFKRRFTKIYGTSPNKWMLQRRMDIAKGLLAYNNEKPADIYHKIGYENHSSFSQAFKQTFGVTPKEFQQQLTFQP